MVIISLTSMWWWRKHIMFMLLSMELMLMSLLILLIYSFTTSNLIPSIFMLVMMASGSSLALSLLVSMTRLHKSSKSIMIWSMTFDKIINSFNFLFSKKKMFDNNNFNY
uniref:NADH-ubiquinone oxidoreductase chain 4L n=1 Tax=Leucauge celebesiana TaxID=1112430 RepID=A0A6B9RC09_9ARAC|nr:NADH dehydrogenase subunit 4L [Leucauge celebesiana]